MQAEDIEFVNIEILRGNINELEIELNKEIARRKLKENFAEKAIQNLKKVLEHKGKKVLNGLKIGVDQWTQTTLGEILE